MKAVQGVPENPGVPENLSRLLLRVTADCLGMYSGCAAVVLSLILQFCDVAFVTCSSVLLLAVV